MSVNDLILDTSVMCEFNKIFESYGVDLTLYKPAFIKRRLDRRMRMLDISNYSQYVHVLQTNRNEFEEIRTSLSINVTNFFRDPTVFDRFRLFVLPELSSKLQKSDQIRIWSAGCASGEEAYSIAILINQMLDKANKMNVEIIANDIHGYAIQFAQRGKYPSKSVECLSSDIVSKNFTKTIDDKNNVEYEIVQNIKDMVTFNVGDILSSNLKSLDVIFCRNVLIYYEKEAQELIFTKFHNSLKDSGYLVLGMDETMFGKRTQKLFHPLSLRERIYQKSTNK